MNDLGLLRPYFLWGGGWDSGGAEKDSHEYLTFNEILVGYWDVLLVLRINGLFHPYKGRLDTSCK